MAWREDSVEARLERDLAELKLLEIAKGHRKVLSDVARKGSSTLELLATLTPQTEFDLTPRILQRAERCCLTRRAYPMYFLRLPRPVLLLEIGPKILIGPKQGNSSEERGPSAWPGPVGP
jgi:hypothetical protein